MVSVHISAYKIYICRFYVSKELMFRDQTTTVFTIKLFNNGPSIDFLYWKWKSAFYIIFNCVFRIKCKFKSLCGYIVYVSIEHVNSILFRRWGYNCFCSNKPFNKGSCTIRLSLSALEVGGRSGDTELAAAGGGGDRASGGEGAFGCGPWPSIPNKATRKARATSETLSDRLV